MQKKILVVDNNPVARKLMENLLVSSGHETRLAEDGLQALDILKTFTPDVMFIDLIMPMVDGKQLCRAVRRSDKFDHTVLTILSAAAAEGAIALDEFGADYCIAKGPFKKQSVHVLNILSAGRRYGVSPAQPVIGLEDIFHREITAELLSSKHHLELILRNTSEGIIEFSPSRGIIFANRKVEMITRKSETELLATDFLSLFEEGIREQVAGGIAESSRSGQVCRMEKTFLMGGRHLLLTLLPAQEGEQQCFIAQFQDVTAQKSLEEVEGLLEWQAKLAHADRLSALGEMASGLAHELKQPITVISLNAQLINKLLPEDPSLRAYVDHILAQVQRATTIISGMSSFSRAKGDRVGLIAPAKAVERALAFFREQFRIQNITLDVHLDHKAIFNGSEQRIEQIVVNLLNNARHAVEQRQQQNGDHAKKLEITLVADQNKQVMRLTVADNGVGFSEEEKQQCFEPFFTTKAVGEGTGLGLTIIKRLAEAMHGTVEIIDGPDGEGSAVSVIFPLERMGSGSP